MKWPDTGFYLSVLTQMKRGDRIIYDKFKGNERIGWVKEWWIIR